jgi:homoprotocatechuate degradation regulator HpaR
MRSLERSLPLTLLRAREAVMDRFRPHLHAHGVTEQQWRVLRALAEYGAMDTSTLSRRVYLLMPSLSRIIRDLCGAGLLKKATPEGDKRVSIVSLSAKGQALFRTMSLESEEIYAALEGAVGRERYRALICELEQFIAAAAAERADHENEEKSEGARVALAGASREKMRAGIL